MGTHDGNMSTAGSCQRSLLLLGSAGGGCKMGFDNRRHMSASET
jgi:hypothetical protein